MILQFKKASLRRAVLSVFCFCTFINPALAAIQKLSPQNFNYMYNLAASGNLTRLSEAQSRGLDINAVNEDGDTGLCVAVKRRNARAYNAFRSLGANPTHPCTWRISYYNDFVSSRAVQSKATWYDTGYTPAVTPSIGKPSMTTWVVGALLIGGGIALAAGGGGGGGGKGDSSGGGDTPPPGGLTCEYGCALYDANGNCIQCNEKPGEDKCITTPCAEGCFTNLTCPVGQRCTQTNACGGCEKCEADDKCISEPCAQGCYTNIACPAGQRCTQHNICGGCESCGVFITSDNNFVKSTTTPLTNTEHLLQTGENKTGSWGGIFSQNQEVINSGSINLDTGSGGIGILSCASDNLEDCINNPATELGGNITNTGEIYITADNSIGIAATSLGTLESSIQKTNNTISNSNNIFAEGKDNTGIALLGNGNIHNTGTIKITGEAEKTNADIIYGTEYVSVKSERPQLENTAIYFSNKNASFQGAQGLNTTINNDGNIYMDITTSASALIKFDKNEKYPYQSINGIAVDFDAQKTNGKLNFSNTGNIDIKFNQTSTPKNNYRTHAIGIDLRNSSSNTAPQIIATNEGDISMSGNAPLTGILIANTQLDNHGNIDITYQSASDHPENVGIHATDSIVNQYGNIDFTPKMIGEGWPRNDFYSVILQNTTFNIKNSSTINGNITSSDLAGTSTINNEGTLKASSIYVDTLNNKTGGTIEIGQKTGAHWPTASYIRELNNEGTISLYDITGNTLINSSSGKLTANSLGRIHSSSGNEDDIYWDSIINNGTIESSDLYIRTNKFENNGTISLDALHYDSQATEKRTVDLSKVTFSSKELSTLLPLKLGSVNTPIQNTKLALTSTVQDDFKLGDINFITGSSDSFGNSSISLLWITPQFGYKGSSNRLPQEGGRSTLSVDNITIDIPSVCGNSQVCSASFDRIPVTAITIDRKMFDTTLNGNLQIKFYQPSNTPHKSADAVYISGEESSFTNLGSIDIQAFDQIRGITSLGANSSIINNGTITLNNFGDGEKTFKSGTYGIYLSNGTFTSSEDSSITITSAATEGKTYGIALYGSSTGENKGKINITAAKDAIGIYAEQTSAAGFKNTGDIEINAADGTGIYASGFVDDRTGGANDRYIKIINSGNITVNGDNTSGITAAGIIASGSKTTVVNTGTISVSGINSDETSELNGGTITDTDPGDNTFDGTRSRIASLSNGATFINKGTITADNLNLDEMQDENSAIIASNGGTIKANSVSGTLLAASEIATGSNQDTYVSKNAVQSENNTTTLKSQSAMFGASWRANSNGGDDLVLTRRSFAELLKDQQLAAYLEQNYQKGSRVDIFDVLKVSASNDNLTAAVNNELGANFIPTLNYQNQQRIKYFNRTMEDLMLDNASDKNERVSIVSNNYYEEGKSHKGFIGFEDKIYGFTGLFDKALSPNFRYGIGLGVYYADADYDGKNTRSDTILQLYNPYNLNYRNWGALIMPHLGYSHGEYKRYTANTRYQPDIDTYYYGLSNRGYLKLPVAGFSFEPTAELNFSGIYQDSIKENNGIQTKAQNSFSIENGIGAYIAKEFDFGSNGKLDFRTGAMYYRELNADAYDSPQARLYGMQGLYRLPDYDNRRDRGIISLRGNYKVKDWNFYGEAIRLLESNDNMIYNAGVRINF